MLVPVVWYDASIDVRNEQSIPVEREVHAHADIALAGANRWRVSMDRESPTSAFENVHVVDNLRCHCC